MKKIQVIIMAAMCLLSTGCGKKEDEGKAPITKPQITIEGGRLTPEGLWAMGRVGSVQSDIEKNQFRSSWKLLRFQADTACSEVKATATGEKVLCT